MFTGALTKLNTRWYAWTRPPRQLIGETRAVLPMRPGEPCKLDYEYRRIYTCNVFMATEPLAGTRMTKVTERRAKCDFAHFVRDIA